MHTFLSFFLIFFAGWTLSAHLCVMSGLNLEALLLVAPVVVTALLFVHLQVTKRQLRNICTTPQDSLLADNTDRGGCRISLILHCGKSILHRSLPQAHSSVYLVCALLISPFILRWSWVAFWLLSVSLLTLALFRHSAEKVVTTNTIMKSGKFHVPIVALVAIITISLSYIVLRSDLDDASYVAIAAFLSANPAHAILSSDPMLGEPGGGIPLVIPTLRFTSFELLSGAIAHLLSAPAMDVYYIYLLPVWCIAATFATFLLAREIIPGHWLLVGALTFLLTLLLGETHRGMGNFSFVRLFQGKAVFLSVMVPAIFYLTARFFSERGTYADLFLLACCQVTSIGLSSFGMLMGPLVGFGALISNMPLANTKKFCYAFVPLLLPLPYLINVALAFTGSPIISSKAESAADVWISVFGSHQQYLVGFLFLAAPVLAKDTVTKWRITVPPLLLLAIYLNPLLNRFISQYVTTPRVYWRITWSFPILVFAAVSFCMLIVEFLDRKNSRLLPAILLAFASALTFYSLPFNTLRPENLLDPFNGFATWKVPATHLAVAKKAVDIEDHGGRLLAPDEIAGVISRFERHPRLVSTRAFYLNLIRPQIGEDNYIHRKILNNFANNNGSPQAQREVASALRTLDVSIIVLNSNAETNDVLAILAPLGFKKRELIDGYTIWVRQIL